MGTKIGVLSKGEVKKNTKSGKNCCLYRAIYAHLAGVKGRKCRAPERSALCALTLEQANNGLRCLICDRQGL